MFVEFWSPAKNRQKLEVKKWIARMLYPVSRMGYSDSWKEYPISRNEYPVSQKNNQFPVWSTMFQETGYSIWETGYSIQNPGNPLVKLGTNFFNKMEVLQTPCNPSGNRFPLLEN